MASHRRRGERPLEDRTVIGADAALLGLIGVVIGSLLSQRGARRVAGEDRLWARKADLFLDLLDWLDEDLKVQRTMKPDWDGNPLRNRVRAFGSPRVDRALELYLDAREHLLQAGTHDAAATLDLRAQFLRLSIRNDLAVLPSRTEDVFMALLGRRPLSGPIARHRARRLQLSLDDRPATSGGQLDGAGEASG